MDRYQIRTVADIRHNPLSKAANIPHVKGMKQQTIPQRPLRLASYNIRKCVGLDMRRAPERVLGVISELDADVVALQEADKRLGRRPAALPARLIETESDFTPVSIEDADGSLGWHGNAVLLRKGAKVERVEKLELPGMEPRGALLVEISINARQMRLVATHLGLMRNHRQAQLRTLQTHIAGLADMPTALLGDFNEWSPYAGMDPLRQNYWVYAPGRSFHAARPVAALDRIAVSHQFELRDAGVHETGDALKASDHLPIWGDFSLR